MSAPVKTQAERSRATTTQLINAARELFVENGYAATSLDAVVETAGVTKGALYHHYASKADLFAAVYEHEQETLVKLIAEASNRRKDPWERFDAGCRAFFEASLDPAVQRITLVDAPAALGWDRLREIEGRHTTALLRAGLQQAIDDGFLPKRPVDPLTHILVGALCEAAMMAARSPNPKRATPAYLREFRAIMDGLRA